MANTKFSLPEAEPGEIERLERNPGYAWLRLHSDGAWGLFLHLDQRYLGRAYVWHNRHTDMARFMGLSLCEMLKLQEVASLYERTLERLWQPDHINYAWLGNEFASHRGHGHLHIIPRYVSERVFDGRTYLDENWGRNYAPYQPRRALAYELCGIRDALRKGIQAP